jgi:hypothetical protein
MLLAQESYDTASFSRDENLYNIELKDGSYVRGKIVMQKRDFILVVVGSNEPIKLLRSDIVSITAKDYKRSDDVLLTSDRIKYNLWNSAYTLEKGKWYYRTIMLESHTFHYGISGRWMAGAGLSLISILAGEPLLYFSTKVKALQAERLHLSLGYDAAVPTVYNDAADIEYPFLGIVSTSLTFGAPRENITFGLGFVQVDNDFSEIPFYVLAGQKSFNERFSVVGEGFFFGFDDENFYAATLGVRIRSKRHSWDIYFALLGNTSESLIIPFPAGNYNLEFR